MVHTSSIVRRLGTLNGKTFLWDRKINPNFVRRRSDFQGVTLNVMAEQEYLNFSAQIFKRRDGQWGMVYPQKDGTFKTVGFIGDLFLKKADFAIGNVIIFQNRAQYVDYLPVLEYIKVNLQL